VFPAELKMDVLREREVKDSLERQLMDEQKIRGRRKFLQKYFLLYIQKLILSGNSGKYMSQV
jgi:hypothetical protein